MSHSASSRTRVSLSLRGARETARRLRLQVTDKVGPRLAPLRKEYDARVAPALGVLTPVGRALLVFAVLGWVLAARLGWTEAAVLATARLLLLVVALPFMIGPTRLEVTTVVEPPRVTVGEALTGELVARNVSRTPLVSAELEFPIGEGGVSFDLPTLLPGKAHSEIFVVPTQRRGVIPVGPVTSVRGDPLGIYRRAVTWTEQSEIFVHPRIAPLEALGAGLIRDLEGNSSQNVSMSDLAFHALREYVAGDDLRHIHWRSSARHGQLLVRQFLDTRRSHLTAIVDSNPTAYRNETDYETAVSVAGSLMVRALLDGYDVSFLSGGVAMTKQVGRLALDACSRAVPETSSMIDVAVRGSQLATDTSLVVLVTGPHSDYLTLQRSASQFGVETGRAAVRVDSDATPGLRARGDLPVLTLTRLEELAMVLKWGLG